jgi:ribosomal protein L29
MKKEENMSSLHKIAELKKELTALRIKASTGETIKSGKAKSLKKEIARIYTQLNSKNK